MPAQKGLSHESSSNSRHKLTQLKNAALPTDNLDEALEVFSFHGSKLNQGEEIRNTETELIKFEALKPYKRLMR